MSARILAVVAVLLVLTPHAGFARSAHTNFASRWVLDTAGSEHGPLTPGAMQLTIEQSGDTIRAAMHSVGTAGDVVTTTTTWNGPALALETVGDIQGQALTRTSVWTLADDGQTLQLALTIEVAGQHLVAHWVLAKSAGSA